MKRTLSYIIAVAVVVGSTVPSFAMPRPVERLKDGVTMVVKSPLEVRDHLKAEAVHGSFLPFSVPGGLLKGGFYMAKTIVHGAVDIATIPIK